MQGHSMFNLFLNGVWCDDLLMQSPTGGEAADNGCITSSLPVRISSVNNRLCNIIMDMWSNRFKLTKHITAASLLPDLGRWLNPNLFVSFQAEPIRVVVTGAAGQIAYSLLYSIAKGDVFGKDQVRSSLNSDYITAAAAEPLPPGADHCTGSWTMHCVGLDCCIMDSSWIIHVSIWGCLRLIGALMSDEMHKLK